MADRVHPRIQSPTRSFQKCLIQVPKCSEKVLIGNPRFPLKGSFKGDRDMGIDIDVDI